MKYSLHYRTVLITLISSLLVLLAFYVEYRLETARIANLFEYDLQERAILLDRQLKINFETIYSIKGLYDSSENITEEEFATYTRPFLARHSEIQALEWIPKILAKDRDEFQRIKKDRYPGFKITQRSADGRMVTAARRDEYYPVSYIEPMAGNDAALGYDLASDTSRAETLDKARQSGELVITGGITLVQDSKREKSILAVLPVYKNTTNDETSGSGRLVGFVLGVFRMTDIFASSSLSSQDHNIFLTLSDISDAGEHSHLYTSHESSPAPAKIKISSQIVLPNIGGRNWLLFGSPSTDYISQLRGRMPYAVLLFGVFCVIVMNGYIHMLRKQAKKVAELSVTDEVTGLSNRRRFNEYLREEWLRAQRNHSPISLLMIDIDFFKAYNDEYGHLCGDASLNLVAGALRSSASRPADLVARYGGEEFVIVLPETGHDAEKVAHIARQKVEALGINFKHGVSDTKAITVSVGFCTMQPTSNNQMDEIILRADQALYQGKTMGRNTVVEWAAEWVQSGPQKPPLHSTIAEENTLITTQPIHKPSHEPRHSA